MSYFDYFRQARTANERRQFYKEPELVRAKRRPLKLWFAWDDLDRCLQRSWKVQKRTGRQHGYDQRLLRSVKRTENSL